MALISLNTVSIKPVPDFLKAGFYVIPFTNTQDEVLLPMSLLLCQDYTAGYAVQNKTPFDMELNRILV